MFRCLLWAIAAAMMEGTPQGSVISPLLASLDQLALFQHTRLQPFLAQADDPSITDPVLDKSYEPFSAQSIEEPGDVGVENPVDGVGRNY